MSKLIYVIDLEQQECVCVCQREQEKNTEIEREMVNTIKNFKIQSDRERESEGKRARVIN